jgi:hypothetical protein
VAHHGRTWPFSLIVAVWYRVSQSETVVDESDADSSFVAPTDDDEDGSAAAGDALPTTRTADATDVGSAVTVVSSTTVETSKSASPESPPPTPTSILETDTTTTTVFEPERTGVLDLTASSAFCGQSDVLLQFHIVNTGKAEAELYQVAVFPYGTFGHTFLDRQEWWPLPVLQPREAASHIELFGLGDEWNEGRVEVFVDSSVGPESLYVSCT